MILFSLNRIQFKKLLTTCINILRIHYLQIYHKVFQFLNKKIPKHLKLFNAITSALQQNTAAEIQVPVWGARIAEYLQK